MSDWFHIAHGSFITANRVKTIFDDVKDFLKLYPNEIVLLDMHRFPVGTWDRGAFVIFAVFIELELGMVVVAEYFLCCKELFHFFKRATHPLVDSTAIRVPFFVRNQD